MTEIPPEVATGAMVDQDVLASRVAGSRRAAGIYGTVITAAVLAAGSDHLTVLQMGDAIIVTLVVYWLAEQYAVLIGEHAQGGHLPTAAEARDSFTRTFPMLSASFIPVLCLLGAHALGASSVLAAYIALYVTIGLLLVHGWVAGRASQLRGLRLVAVTISAGLLGALMVVLKVSLAHV